MSPRSLNLAIQKGQDEDEYIMTAFIERAELPAQVSLSRDQLTHIINKMREHLDELRKDPLYEHRSGYSKDREYKGDFFSKETRYSKQGVKMTGPDAFAAKMEHNKFMKEMAILGSDCFKHLFSSRSAMILREVISEHLNEGDTIQVWIEENGNRFCLSVGLVVFR